MAEIKTEIYYFSGTGNTFAVAKDLAERTGGSLIPIAALAGQAAVTTEADTVGLVFPVYDGAPPVIVQEFAVKAPVPW